MDYEGILTGALRISWRHRYLWLLALLAAEGTGVTWSMFNRSSRGGSTTRAHAAGSAVGWAEVTAWVGAHELLLIAGAAAVLALGVVLLLVSAVATGGIVRAVVEHAAGRPFSLGAAWRSGRAAFRPVLGLKLLAVAAFTGAFTVIGSIVLACAAAVVTHHVALAVTAGAAAALLVLLAIPALLVFQVVLLLGVRAAVIDRLGSLAALSAAWALFRRRFARVALLWLLVGVIAAVLGVAVDIAVVVVALPLAGLVAGAYLAGGVAGAVVAGGILGVIWLAVALALLGAVGAYYSAAWTLAYTRFDEERVPAPAPSPSPA